MAEMVFILNLIKQILKLILIKAAAPMKGMHKLEIIAELLLTWTGRIEVQVQIK